MPKTDTKRKTFTELIQEMDEMLSVSVTQEDAKKIIDTFANKLKENAEAYSRKLNENKAEMNRDVQAVRDELAQLQSTLQETINSVDQKNGTTLAEAIQQIQSEIKEVNEAIPELPDLSDLYEMGEVFDERMSQAEMLLAGENIRNALEALPSEDENGDDQRLKASAVQGLDELIERVAGLSENVSRIQTTPTASIVGRDIIADIDISSQLNGSKKTFNIQAIYNIISVDTSSFPHALRKNIDYTYTDTSITFTDEIAAASTLASGQTVIITAVLA